METETTTTRADIAQVAEHTICNRKRGVSSTSVGSILSNLPYCEVMCYWPTVYAVTADGIFKPQPRPSV